MNISRLRWIILFVSFFLLMFGAYAGLYLGSFLPTFSCCYVNTRAGTCFMLTLQQIIGEFTLDSMLVFLERLLYFSILVIILGRAWCGWICPLGFIQDLLDYIRQKLRVGYVRFSEKLKRRLLWIKWTFLSIALFLPVWVAFPVICPGAAINLYIPFCQMCPGKYLLPLCSGNPDRISVNYETATNVFMSTLGLAFSGITFIGSFVKRRFWCSFCPLGLILSWYRKISFIKLKKDDVKCTRCEICYNTCPMEIEEVYKSRGREDVTFSECTLCLKCVENCPEEGALKAEFKIPFVPGITLYKSSFKKFINKRVKKSSATNEVHSQLKN
ncbi:MAG: 4Fe-4S binding protein [Spirochaetes bacterium]|nr:4Fe-4S binding protein [Spirochaetota bacterium]